MTTVSGSCFVCEEKQEVQVNREKFHAWKNDEGYIQDLMPELSAAEREFLLSGTCGPCFEKMFLAEEE